jgi:hypothetical protein
VGVGVGAGVTPGVGVASGNGVRRGVGVGVAVGFFVARGVVADPGRGVAMALPGPAAGDGVAASGADGVLEGSGELSSPAAAFPSGDPIAGAWLAGRWVERTPELGVPVTLRTPPFGAGGQTARTISTTAESPSSVVTVSRIRRIRGSGGRSTSGGDKGRSIVATGRARSSGAIDGSIVGWIGGAAGRGGDAGTSGVGGEAGAAEPAAPIR